MLGQLRLTTELCSSNTWKMDHAGEIASTKTPLCMLNCSSKERQMNIRKLRIDFKLAFFPSETAPTVLIEGFTYSSSLPTPRLTFSSATNNAFKA